MERKSVNLSSEDLARLGPYLERGSPEQAELARAVAEEDVPYLSDSHALRALALLGTKKLEDERLERGYADLAASLTDADQAFVEEAFEVAMKMWSSEE